MKAKKITYEKLYNRDNYENERFGVEIELEDGDKTADAFTAAKKIVKAQADGIFDSIMETRKILKENDIADIM